MKLDLSQDQDNQNSENLGPVPEGRYDCVIDDTRYYKAKTGMPMFEIRLSVLDEKYKNRKAWRGFPLSEKAVGFINELLEAVGSDLAGSPDLEVDQLGPAVKNKKVSVYLAVEKYKDKLQNKPGKIQAIKTGATPLKSRKPVSKEDEEESLFA